MANEINNDQRFSAFQTEEEARTWLWQIRSGGKNFRCPHCGSESFYVVNARPEARKCKGCARQIRVRAGTLLQGSKLPILKWLQALDLVVQGQREISARKLRQELQLKSYGTTWLLLQKIREALRRSDERGDLVNPLQIEGILFEKKTPSKSTSNNLVAIDQSSVIPD